MYYIHVCISSIDVQSLNCSSLNFPAVQIHYVPERKHWVASSYFDGKVRLYDSLFNGKLTPSIEVQLIQLYRPAIRDGALVVTASLQSGYGGTCTIAGWSSRLRCFQHCLCTPCSSKQRCYETQTQAGGHARAPAAVFRTQTTDPSPDS